MNIFYLIIAVFAVAGFADSVWQFWRGWRTGVTRQLGFAGIYNDVQLECDNEDDWPWFIWAMIVRAIGMFAYPCAFVAFSYLALTASG